MISILPQAQCLRSPITSYQKLATSNQTLYIMKEETSNKSVHYLNEFLFVWIYVSHAFTHSGKGVIVGILKTGQKNLFLCVNNNYNTSQFNILCSCDAYYSLSLSCRTHVGYSMKYLRCVYSTSMSMSPSKDVAMERSSLRQC